MLENISYLWFLMSIYIYDLMEIHRHMLVFIYLVTKFFIVLGLTRVDFYHSYTYLILTWYKIIIIQDKKMSERCGASLGLKEKCKYT